MKSKNTLILLMIFLAIVFVSNVDNKYLSFTPVRDSIFVVELPLQVFTFGIKNAGTGTFIYFI